MDNMDTEKKSKRQKQRALCLLARSFSFDCFKQSQRELHGKTFRAALLGLYYFALIFSSKLRQLFRENPRKKLTSIF
jgi:hypothetical protein